MRSRRDEELHEELYKQLSDILNGSDLPNEVEDSDELHEEFEEIDFETLKDPMKEPFEGEEPLDNEELYEELYETFDDEVEDVKELFDGEKLDQELKDIKDNLDHLANGVGDGEDPCEDPYEQLSDTLNGFGLPNEVGDSEELTKGLNDVKNKLGHPAESVEELASNGNEGVGIHVSSRDLLRDVQEHRGQAWPPQRGREWRVQ